MGIIFHLLIYNTLEVWCFFCKILKIYCMWSTCTRRGLSILLPNLTWKCRGKEKAGCLFLLVVLYTTSKVMKNTGNTLALFFEVLDLVKSTKALYHHIDIYGTNYTLLLVRLWFSFYFSKYWKELKNLIPKSAVGTLSSNSSNVIQLIIDAYNVSSDFIWVLFIFPVCKLLWIFQADAPR